jgi:hypothetical protein
MRSISAKNLVDCVQIDPRNALAMQATTTQAALWWGISTETWAIVLATFSGPVVAILITRWRDWVRERRGRRLTVFRTLLATRRQAITPEHVTALNLIEIDFYGIGPIEGAWREYNRHLNSAPRDRPMTATENQMFEEKRNDLLAKLLFAIAKFLGFTMSEIDLRNGGYAPDGWRYRDDRLGLIQEFAKDLASGQRALPVYALQAAPPSQTAPSQKSD